MADRLKGKVAIITGSGRGIGKAIAVAMAQEGAKVVVNDLGVSLDGTGSSRVADETLAEIKKMGGVAVANYDTVTTHQGAENIIRTALNNFGSIDILVNNAGIMRDRMPWNMTDEEWDTVIKTNLYGHFYCTRSALTPMREAIKVGKQKGGRIINFTSHAGIMGSATQTNYSTAKMGVVGFTYSCALALGRDGITCNAVAPRAQTRLTDTVPDEKWRQIAKTDGMAAADTMPIDELKNKFIGGFPEAVAPIVCWLASDDSKNINGQVFVAAGWRVGVFSSMHEAKVAFKDGSFTLDEMWQIMPVLTAELRNPA